MEKVSIMSRLGIIATVITLLAIVMILVGNTYKRIEPHSQNSYLTPTMKIKQPLPSQVELSAPVTMNAENFRFTGNNTFTGVDANNDGLFEALRATVEVHASAAGEYSIFGVLQKGGTTIANGPSFESMLFTAATFTSGAGPQHVDIAFSGEQIFRSGQDGIYDLSLSGVGPDNTFANDTFQTTLIDHTRYGELGAALTGSTEGAIDNDENGTFDFVKVLVDINVRVGGDFVFQGYLSTDKETIASARHISKLKAGMHRVTLHFPGTEISRSSQDGPYSGRVDLHDARGENLEGASFTTKPYKSVHFDRLLKLDGSFHDKGIDTNNNGLFDRLRIDFTANVWKEGNYLVGGELTGPGEEIVTFGDSETAVHLSAGKQTIQVEFTGPMIREQGKDGPYKVTVIMKDPKSYDELERITVGTTHGFGHTDFDPFP